MFKSYLSHVHIEGIGTKARFFIFVYGTLMRGFKRRESLTKDPKSFIFSFGDYKLSGYKLHVNNNIDNNLDYPVLTTSNDVEDFVIGELIETNQYTYNMICGIEKGYTPVPFVLNCEGQTRNFTLENMFAIGENPILTIVGQPCIIFLTSPEAVARNFNETTQLLKHSFRHFCNRTPIAKFKKALLKHN